MLFTFESDHFCYFKFKADVQVCVRGLLSCARFLIVMLFTVRSEKHPEQV